MDIIDILDKQEERTKRQTSCRIKIEDFLCIKNADIIVSDITVLIGEQASGKSVISKAYFFLQESLSTAIYKSIMESTRLTKMKSDLKSLFASIFPRYSWENDSFKISVSVIINNTEYEPHVTITHTPGCDIKFTFSKQLLHAYRKTSTGYKKVIQKQTSEDGSTYKLELFSNLNKYDSFTKIARSEGLSDFFDDVSYIPSGRAFFSTIKDNVFGFLSESIGIDQFLKMFGRNYELAKRITRDIKKNNSVVNRFDKISSSVLKGEFKQENGEDWIVSGENIISVSHASSGQQESLPLLLVLRKELIINDNDNRTIVVEEPEAHLYPLSQKSVVDLIFYIKKQTNNLKFIITTHSPYVLSCINNGVLKNKDVVVSAYFLKDGAQRSIVDKDLHIINCDDLDSISTEISNEFYEIIGDGK